MTLRQGLPVQSWRRLCSPWRSFRTREKSSAWSNRRKKADLNTIANRTLISNETNAKISDKAPADYIEGGDIFPAGPTPELLHPHFISEEIVALMKRGVERLTAEETAELYQQFVREREKEIISEVRRVCGITATGEPLTEAELEVDEVAADVEAEILSVDEPLGAPSGRF